ncbi:alpha/beta hydrolase family protein [Roseibium suaedae]|uniref:Predicted alpha/beta hydrolase n=1 Tax=Roseibium suaedae TaxID=735517 RepID=A0A1M7BL75_9HYPH|nr:alpha/beta fold hydrolase [Roseibium suaedae]SHL55721.1 Predicted alpha/beta hydrolase [Roseibium suaedae]
MNQSDEVTIEAVRIPAANLQLAGLIYRPLGASRGLILLNGATGVPQSFYRHFAAWAAREHGFMVLTYDYRGFGQSGSGSLRGNPATMADWGVLDQAAAFDFAEEIEPSLPLWIVGHSLGGLMLDFQRNSPRLERVITVGAGMAHLADHPLSYLPLVLAFWYGPGPLSVLALRYLPGRHLGVGEDLPAGVYWQWRKWCTTRGFYQKDLGTILPMPRQEELNADVKLVTMSDDKMVPPVAVWRYADRLKARSVSRSLLTATDFGLGRIGHIEVFSRSRSAVWPSVLG